MANEKTSLNDVNVVDFIDCTDDETRRQDWMVLLDLVNEVKGEFLKM